MNKETRVFIKRVISRIVQEYSKSEYDRLVIVLADKSSKLANKQNQVQILIRSLTSLQDIHKHDRHKDGSIKLDENKRKITITQKPIDQELGIEMTNERRNAIFTKICTDCDTL